MKNILVFVLNLVNNFDFKNCKKIKVKIFHSFENGLYVFCYIK